MKKPFWTYDLFLKILGFCALFSILPFAGDVAVVAGFTIIGLPITFLIIIAPMLFLVLITLKGVRKYFKLNWFLSLVIAAVILMIPPFFANRLIGIKADFLLADDVDNITEKPKLTSLAVVYARGYVNKNTCDDFCQRALLNGQVDKMIMVRVKSPIEKINWKIPAQAFWFEPRNVCPSIEVEENRTGLGIRNNDVGMKTGRDVSDLLRLEANKGNCLLSETVTLGDADAALVYGSVNFGKTGYKSGFNLFADVNNADRLAFYKKINDEMSMVYQSTALVSRPLFPVLVPTLMSGRQLNTRPGFLRLRENLGAAKQYHQKIDLAVFLKTKLGLQLNVSGEGLEQEILASVLRILDKQGDLSGAEIESVYDFLGLRRNWPADVGNLGEIVVRTLNDLRIPIAARSFRMVERFSDGQEKLLKNEQVLKDIAKALFLRLEHFKPDLTQEKPYDIYAELRYITEAIDKLPDFAILPYLDNLVVLAHNKEQREHGWLALKRLYVFEQKAISTIFYLFNDVGGKYNSARKSYRAAYYDLCMLGKGGHVNDELRIEIHKNVEKLGARSGNFKLAKLLFAIGDSPDEIFLRLKFDDDMAKSFKRDMGRYAKRFNCKY